MTTALIGRDHPAGLLRGEINRASESHGGLVLVTGEAGIGKTTLVTGAVEEARRLGALVLSGSCWDSDSAPGYWPWVQVIRALRRAATAEEWATAGSGLEVLLGEAPAGEADSFALYDAVTTALVAVSQRRPVVVVLDDLHWADTASLRLLEFAAQHTWFERLLLVGTYRDVEVEATAHPLQPLMLPLVAKATTVTLTGLDRDDVGTLIARTAGHEPDPELVSEVHLRTGGNPFFVEQTARLWRSGGTLTAIAPGVRDALQRRMSLLPEAVVDLLTSAAVLGREFHRQLLAAAVSAPVPHVDRLLDQAATARLVTALGGGRFAFAHDLVRETLYDALDEPAARRQHAAVVHAIDRNPPLAERIFPADLARHAYLAGEDLDRQRAIERLVAAARDAGGRLATEESIVHYRRALERSRGGDPAVEVRITLDLGGCLRHAGLRDEARRVFDDAVALARGTGDAVVLARVALTLYMHDSDRTQVVPDLLDEAHRTLVRDGAEAGEPLPPDQLARELTIRVMALARGGDDDEALVFSLWARHDAIWGLGTAAERLVLIDELLAVIPRTDDFGAEHFASSMRWVTLIELGDPAYLDQLTRFVAMVDGADLPMADFSSAIDQSIIAAFQGRFAEADTLLDRALDAASDYNHHHFSYMADHMRWAHWLLQGRLDELDPVHRALVEHRHPFPHLLMGITALHRGDVEAARRHYDERPEAYPRMFAPLGLRFEAQLAAATGDPALCARARAALEPYSGQWVVSVYGCDLSGPVDLWLATLDAAEKRWDSAVARFTAARESAQRMRARPWAVLARAGLADALHGRGDLARAGAVRTEVEREAAELDMRHPAGQPVPEAVGANAFRRDGPVWAVSFADRSVHLPDAKGLRDLHTLLGQPGADVPAVVLLDPDGGDLVVAARRLGGDDVLDDEAKTRYKRRLDQLDDEIERAAERGDDQRAASLDQEREALLHELRAAAGLGGRTRRLGDEAERARKTVTARIRDTLRKLDEQHPELAAHLREAVATGSTCRYEPDPSISWRL